MPPPPILCRMSERYVLDLDKVDITQIALVGGKGAHLGELFRIEDASVPEGFCVTTDAFRRIIAFAPSIDVPLEQMSHLNPEDRDSIRTLSSEVRRTLEGIAIADDVEWAITSRLARFDDQAASAIRSSATAEDSPTASFAGQHDTYLNVVGAAAILQHIRRCWASLFTERAVTYRLRNGIDHRKVHMAVVVQRMVFADASGILFTADPCTGNRKVSAVEATFGLGEAVVSGLVNTDAYRVRDDEIVERSVGAKQFALRAVPGAGTQRQPIDRATQDQPALSDAQVVRLAQLGRRIETHFGQPQDIEWCLVDGDFRIVQSRPITTLFPLPEIGDRENHVYISVGHQQMMTDPMKPLGLSVWQLTAFRPMYAAGGRLFVDVTQDLASPATRARILTLGKSDPLIGDALQTILDRGDFIPLSPDSDPGPAHAVNPSESLGPDPAIVDELIKRSEASLSDAKRDIDTKSGAELFDFILADIQELKRILFDPRSHQVFMAAMEATAWLNAQLLAWLGEKNAADTLTLSVPNNVTSEMGMALLDVADVIRPHPEVVAFLERVDDDGFLDEMDELSGGQETGDAIRAFLDKYGMRCVGEIDITRPRWTERPTTLLPIILGNIKHFEPGAAARRFERGRQEAWLQEQDLLERLRALPDGERMADETKRMIDRVRTFIGYREYPKYDMISRYFVYRRALLKEAERLVRAHVLREIGDILFLTFHEFHAVARSNEVDNELIELRKGEFASYQKLTPPRVLTSEGEVVGGTYRRDHVPAGTLLGLPVSSGTVEGRARVVLNLADADLEPGDILVTTFTDPSWTPLFVAITGLVTEVGGLMTHGAVIAREYGVPAVVGVEHATLLIRDGQRIRVNGTDGYVEILP
ncbi:MAG: phosphoenolpyruvate synthase [Actinomycetota bacterium]